jgi:hypothetical protein
MSTVYYPSIYDNTYKYTELVNNSIIITTQTGYGSVAAENNTVLICNENGQWVTSSLDNYATSSDITNIQNSINTLSTYSDILQQSISTNLNAINTLQTNLADNYFTKEEITSSNNLLNNMLSEVYGEISSLKDDITIINDDITTISNKVQILSENLLYIEAKSKGENWLALDAPQGYIELGGTWKLYGTVTLYISDITKMTPKVDTLTPEEWLAALPIFKIIFSYNHIGGGSSWIDETVFQGIIESNRPLITIPVSALLKWTHDDPYIMYFKIILNNPDNINITRDDFYLYSFNLYLERISGCEPIHTDPI